jgi:serine/threonine protein kinase/HAMP domain-containing protein
MVENDANESAAARQLDAEGARAALEKRVAMLEKVVAMERRLRQLQKAAVQGVAPAPPAVAAPPVDDDSTVLHRPAPPDDSTVLHRPAPPDDSTVLHRPANAPAPVDAGGALVLAPGFQLHEYRIDAVLGQGGFGVTYLASDVHLNAKVAIKEYLPCELAVRANDKSVSPRWPEDATMYQDGLDNFLVEARTLATFRHPNIVRVARFFEANHTAYMVLEYERGKSLKEWWPGRKNVAEAELLTLLQPLIDGLAVVHGAGFLHRDIKPDNIYVRKEDGSLVLLDFGAARQGAGKGNTLSDVVTPGYAPPEQYHGGRQGPWTDIYALGATLYWMIAQVKPPPSPARLSGEQTMVSALEAGRGRYSEAFLRAVDWALQPEPSARPQDLQSFADKLYASHAGSLALHDALRAGEQDAGFGNESLRALLDSPRLLMRRTLAVLRAVNNPGSWPMVVKMMIAMVIAALAPMIITAKYNLNASVQTVSASELLDLQRLAQSTAGRVTQLITDSQNLANYMAADADFIAYLQTPDEPRKALLESKLATLIKTNPDIHLMFLMDAQGLALVSSEPGVAGMNFKFREYFKEAVQGRPFKTGIIVGSTAGKRGMYYANPVVDGAGAVIGVVVLRIKASTISDILEETAGARLMPFMIDGDGILIHHRDAAQLHRSLDTLKPDVQGRIAADQRFRKSQIDSLHMPQLAQALVGTSQSGSISYRSTISGADEYAGYAPVKGHNWVVGVSESRLNFEAPLRDLYNDVLRSVAVVGLLFLVMAVLFSRSIVRPIARLTEAANALKEGDYDRANIKVTTGDEIGRLARTFNVMIDVLRQREREKRRSRPDRYGDDGEDGA